MMNTAIATPYTNHQEDEGSRQVSIQAGVTPTIDHTSTAEISLYYGHDSGFLSNQYLKIVRLDSETGLKVLSDDDRPDVRTSGGISARYIKSIRENLVGNPIKQGWVWTFPLEYEFGATEVTRNLSPIATVYNTRLMGNGRNRVSNKNGVLTRSGKTDDYSVGADFDYVQTPPAGLQDKIKGLVDYLAARADTAAVPSTVIDTSAVLAAWYSSYNATTAPIILKKAVTLTCY